VTAGVLATDVASLASGRSEGPLRRILRVEAVVAGVAMATGTMLLRDPEVREARDEGWGIGRPEMLRRLALGLLFGILSARLRVAARGETKTADAGSTE
jgi:hypothetical protein